MSNLPSININKRTFIGKEARESKKKTAWSQIVKRTIILGLSKMKTQKKNIILHKRYKVQKTEGMQVQNKRTINQTQVIKSNINIVWKTF